MIINEIFYSLQGEGFLAGRPSVFVRLAGCRLRCRWCDTKYAWDPEAGRPYNLDEIVKTVLRYPCRFVVITGGEPLANPELPELAKTLKAADMHITIETAGVSFVPDLACDLMSISPKLSNSKVENKDSKLNIESLRKLVSSYNYQIKFVVDSPDDLQEIEETLKGVGNIDRGKVMLMPQAITRDEFIRKSPMVAEMCKNNGFTFSQRLHILLWDTTRGK